MLTRVSLAAHPQLVGHQSSGKDNEGRRRHGRRQGPRQRREASREKQVDKSGKERVKNRDRRYHCACCVKKDHRKHDCREQLRRHKQRPHDHFQVESDHNQVTIQLDSYAWTRLISQRWQWEVRLPLLHRPVKQHHLELSMEQ